MKGIKLIFAVCLGFLAIHETWGDDATDTARAAVRRGAANTIVQSRQKSATTQQNTTGAELSRSTITSSASKSPTSTRDHNTTTRSGVVVRDNARGDATTTGNVSVRPNGAVQSRATENVVGTKSRNTVRSAISAPRTTGATVGRTATTPTNSSRAATTISRSATRTTPGTGTAQSAPRRATAASRIVRSATDTAASTPTAADVMNKDYKKCRQVYYDCMDEFCANKDSQLKRCACSTRVNEFDGTKKQLATVEDKLLDFNQRLLTVNMDKEDAQALFTATEGELAFNQADKSQSKKMLDEIAKKLNTTFDDSGFDQNLNAISLSLNVDAAFDTVDSLQGASTTTKTGVALYNAALPVCREMAAEVCTDDELAIAESGYQMTIEQDCNTVAKSYATQNDQAREKIREGSALLDMSRLDIYQKRNSDDILTCKKKMLDMLSDSTVCGENLGKCLDTSGRYIDPSTGEAFLTVDLANLGNLITRPDENQTWTNAPGNEVFVSYLNSKKKFLAPAMENCQDIADYVWDEFIEDALAQIKLAQESKLEDMRQSCTTLTTQCLSKTADSLEDFDARALSIFGVAADKTVNAMCAEVQTACTALLESTGGDQDWVGGMTEIATDKTYDTIMQTCREVGRACIIQACKSISGNFGLCENIQTSVNRKSIINRTACWDEVKDCVRTASENSINNIFVQLATDGILNAENQTFYETLYGTNPKITNWEKFANDDASKSEFCSLKPGSQSDLNCILDICEEECGYKAENGTGSYEKTNSYECKVCRLAEKIWGNCETIPSQPLTKAESHNRIRIPRDSKTETLLSWFAKNTGTDNVADSCRDTSCGPGYVPYWDTALQTSVCIPKEDLSDDGVVCPSTTYWQVNINNHTNCCKAGDDSAGTMDAFGNCCLGQRIKTIENLNWGAINPYFGENRGTVITPLPAVLIEARNIAGPNPDTEGIKIPQGLCLPVSEPKFVLMDSQDGTYYGNGKKFLICLGTVEAADVNAEQGYPAGQTLKCKGKYVFVNKNTGRYITPNYTTGPNGETLGTTPTAYPSNFYNEENGTPQCTRQYSDSKWQWTPDQCSVQEKDIKHWLIKY